MDTYIRNEWLAELLIHHRGLITKYWIEEIRAEGIPGYHIISDEELREELPPTVDSMIYTLQTGDTEGARRHSIGTIQRRLAQGFMLPDLQMSLHALETAVMRIVNEADAGIEKEAQALLSASTMYYMVALIAAGVYEHLRTEQQRRFTTAYEFGITLNKYLDLDTILGTSVRKVAEYIGGESVAILLAKPGSKRDEVRAYHNLDSEIVKAMPAICESLGCEAVDADSSNMRETTGIVSDVRISKHLDRWSGMLASRGHLSMVYAPLLAKQKRLGSIVIWWPEVRNAADSEMDYLFAMAGHIANAIQNAILFEEAKGKRELGVLLEASRLFASSLNTKDIISKIAKMATEAVNADLAIVFTQDQQQERPGNVAYYACNRKAKIAVRQLLKAVVPDGEENEFGTLWQDLARGKPILFGSSSQFSEQLQSVTSTIESGLIVPLRQKDVLHGVFALMSLDQNAFTENDLLLATGLADLAAVAIENAQLYEYERNISETLQRSFLPSHLPSIEGYETAAYYRSAMAEADVGGDFYDLFTIGEGRISIIIGDVSGKGLKASIPTAMGKYMVRAYATENPSPSNVLTRFNRAFYENVPEGLFMTAFYGTLDPKDNVFTYVSAGHNPPLLYSSASNRVTQIPTTGICLGITEEAEYTDKKIQLQPGDALLLYTDGATDVKNDSRRLEVEGLEQLFLSSAREPVERIVRNVSSSIVQYSHDKLPDDVALVVLKRLEAGSPG